MFQSKPVLFTTEARNWKYIHYMERMADRKKHRVGVPRSEIKGATESYMVMSQKGIDKAIDNHNNFIGEKTFHWGAGSKFYAPKV